MTLSSEGTGVRASLGVGLGVGLVVLALMGATGFGSLAAAEPRAWHAGATDPPSSLPPGEASPGEEPPGWAAGPGSEAPGRGRRSSASANGPLPEHELLDGAVRPAAAAPGAGRLRQHDRARGVAQRAAAALVRSRGPSRSASPGTAPSEQPEPEHSSIRRYLTGHGERLDEVLDVGDIRSAPSNVVADGELISVMAWDVRLEEPRGSYLYVLQDDREARVAQVHRFFCLERRLDVLAETCVPIASVYSNAGIPTAVGYTEAGQPVATEPRDLDPWQFSRWGAYLEANEYLLFLQSYFESLRG